jgi:Glycosyl transferase family 8/Alpha-2,3-sialyltransferase (CST-I)
MPPMRTFPLSGQPGDVEIAAFADLVQRPLLIVGNGPSATLPPHHKIPSDVVIFRMNWFFLESHYHFGSHVDAWFFAIPNKLLEASLSDEIRTGRYTVERLCSPMQLPSSREGDRWANQMLDVNLKQYDHWAVISRHPRLARYFMSRPGLPTTGMQALGFGLGLGFREVYLSGIDLYESKEARYGYTISQQVAAGLLEKDMRPGYEDAHSIDVDLSFLQAALAEFPDADVYSLSESVNLGLYVPPGKEISDRPTMSPSTTPHLGEPKERIAVVLPENGPARQVTITEPRDGRLYETVEGRKCAYVTVVSGPYYHHGVRALANSLRKVSSIPLLALCTHDADQSALAASGVHVLDVPEIVNPNRTRRLQPRFVATYTKLNVFRLDFLDRLVYLDGDTVVLQNVDDLFAGDDFAAAPDAGLDRANGKIFNSGVFAVSPSHELFASMLDRLGNTASYDGGDQGFLNNIFPHWRRLPQEYNTTKRMFAHHPALFNAEEIKVLHYVGVKPWEPVKPGAGYDELDLRWLEFLADWELRELTRSLRDRTGANGVTELTPTAALLRKIALRARKAALAALSGKGA